MRYPSFIKKGGTIGLVAPSFGAAEDPYFSRLNSAITRFEDYGFQVKLSQQAFNLKQCQSDTPPNRGQEIMQFYCDPNVDVLLSIAGGERMIEILPYLDFLRLKNCPPKFFQGYSDNTFFTFTLTTLCDVATLYGAHAPDFGMSILDESLAENLEIIQGRLLQQESYDFYEIESLKNQPGNVLVAYNKIHPVEYTTIIGGESVTMEGRLLGGCLDVLVNLVGTPFDQVQAFIHKYQEDGIIWYLEAAELTPAGVLRSLWQLKQTGWFKHVRGFIFGRPGYTQPFFDYTHEQAVFDALTDLNVEVVMNVDFGHLPPMFTIINGALSRFHVSKGKGHIRYILK